jgi:RNA polymerase sigma-70 factor (ECF subfamily)
MSSEDVREQLVSFMPKMRGWALALTRNSSAADDLIQDVAAKVVASNSFQPGTNFGAWIHRIMVNHFITGMRSQQKHGYMEAIPDRPVSAAHEDSVALSELAWKFDRLPADQKEALSLIVLKEESYERASEISGCAIGTLKSRVHRARLQLRAYMDDVSERAA